MRSPPRDAISTADRRLLAHAPCTHVPRHTHAHAHANSWPRGHAAPQHRSTAAPQHARALTVRFRPRGARVYADCFGWECVRRAGSPGKGGRRRHAPPLPEPHRPPRYPCTFLDLTVSFRMPRFDSTSIDSIVLFVCLLLCIFFGVVFFTSLLVRGCAELLAYRARSASFPLLPPPGSSTHGSHAGRLTACCGCCGCYGCGRGCGAVYVEPPLRCG